MVLRLLVLVLQLLQHHHGRAVSHLAAGDVPVFNMYDGMLRMAAADVVDHDLAFVAELRRDACGNLFQCFQSLRLQ